MMGQWVPVSGPEDGRHAFQIWGLDLPALAPVFKLPCPCWQPSAEELVRSISHCWNRFIYLGTFSFFFNVVHLCKLRSHTHSLHLTDFKFSKFLREALPYQFSFFAETPPVEMESWESQCILFLSAAARGGSGFWCLSLPGLEV